MKLKCRKCREFLMDSSCFIDSHGKPCKNLNDMESNCIEDQSDPVWNVNYDVAPDWMKSYFDQGNWLKGKIFCPKCDGRVGSYNFTQPRKCACGQSVAPPVWLMKSRIDASIPPVLRQSKPAVIDETWTLIKTSVPDKLTPEQSTSLNSTEINTSLQDQSSNDEIKLLKSKMFCEHNSSDSADTDTQEIALVSLARSKEQRQKLIDRRRKKIKKIRKRNEEKVKKCEGVLQKLQEKLLEEYKCPICLDLCAKPTQCIPCEHVFCGTCLEQFNELNEGQLTCPLCRNFIRNCKMAKELDNFLRDAFSLGCERKTDLNKNIEKIETKLPEPTTPVITQGPHPRCVTTQWSWSSKIVEDFIPPTILYSLLVLTAATGCCYIMMQATS